MRVGPGHGRPTGLGMIFRISLPPPMLPIERPANSSPRGRWESKEATATHTPLRSASTNGIVLDCLTRMETCGSGARIGSTKTRTQVPAGLIRPVPNQEPRECIAVAVGPARRNVADPPAASAETLRPIEDVTLAFASCSNDTERMIASSLCLILIGTAIGRAEEPPVFVSAI